MEVIKFFEELKRMCDAHLLCKNCPLKLKFCDCHYDKNFEDVTHSLEKEELIKIIEIVDKWSKENPRKTRQSEFLKMFPNVRLYGDQIDICPKTVDVKSNLCNEYDCECDKCKKDYWFTEVE